MKALFSFLLDCVKLLLLIMGLSLLAAVGTVIWILFVMFMFE